MSGYISDTLYKRMTAPIVISKDIVKGIVDQLPPFDDYFLPSIDALKAMHTELYLHEVGNFNDESGVFYYSSTEYDGATWARGIEFLTGADMPQIWKGNVGWVRACRKFTSITVYALRDTGPAGGLIFWKSGNDYLETAPSDIGSMAWSNIDNVEIGVTAQGSEIGTGQVNTLAIIGQNGHTTSAAKLCNDLVIGGADVTLTAEQLAAIAASIPAPEVDLSGVVAKETNKSLVADTEIAKIHSLNADNQDLSNLVVKVTGSSLVVDSEIAKIHALNADNQDLSNLVVKVTNKSLVLDTEISKIHALNADNQDLSGLQPKESGKGLSATDLTSALKTSYDGAVTHAGSTHAPSNAQPNNISDANATDLTDGGETTLHTHPAGATSGGMNLLKTTANQTINAGAGTFANITGLTFPVVNGVSYAFYFYITFQSAATTTGWRAGVNCPTGALDFWATSEIIANGAAGVATHTERHNTVRDDMTLLTATITQAVDLAIEIRGRYLCTQNGTFACRFANELASNTQIVVQKGSWGWWF